MNRTSNLIILHILVLNCLLVACAFAVQPARFNYQAKLSDSSGVPLQGNHTIYFSIFAGGSRTIVGSGANVYSEYASVPAAAGVVNHVIGTGAITSGTLTSADLASRLDHYLEVAVDTPSNVLLPRVRLLSVPFAARADYAPASLFSVFGGTGSAGDMTYTNGMTLSNSFDRVEYQNLTVPAGQTYPVRYGPGCAFIGVRGTCTIHGSINGTGTGAQGGLGTSGTGNVGYNATTMEASRLPVPGCVTGAGGAGGSISGALGGAGGGAQALGGFASLAGGQPGAVALGLKRLTGGAESGQGKTHFESFPNLLQYVGAGGGGGAGSSSFSGSVGGNGGPGGGVIYIECNELVFTGSLVSRGNAGLSGFSFGGPFGGGGGGGGGVVLVRARKITTNTGTVDVSGGTGYPGAGNGGAGYWDIVQVP